MIFDDCPSKWRTFDSTIFSDTYEEAYLLQWGRGNEDNVGHQVGALEDLERLGVEAHDDDDFFDCNDDDWWLSNLGVQVEDTDFLGVDDGADRPEARSVVSFLVLAVLNKLPDRCNNSDDGGTCDAGSVDGNDDDDDVEPGKDVLLELESWNEMIIGTVHLLFSPGGTIMKKRNKKKKIRSNLVRLVWGIAALNRPLSAISRCGRIIVVIVDIIVLSVLFVPIIITRQYVMIRD